MFEYFTDKYADDKDLAKKQLNQYLLNFTSAGKAPKPVTSGEK